MADNIPNIDFNVAPGETVAVPVDATLSISGQAADAKAVGDALANKADRSELARSIHVNGQGADLQGEIILTAEHVPMDENETGTVADEVAALKGRTGADIPVNGEDGAISIEAALNTASTGVTVQGGVAVMAGQVTDDSGSVNSLEISGMTLPLQDSGAVRSVNGIAGDSAGNVRITNVETANNLVADDAQSNVAAFTLRTSGGGTAIANGRAWLNQVRGAMEHTGVVEERIDMTVEPAAREAGQQTITATIDQAAFRAAVPESGTIALVYGAQDWSEDPASMGITVSGTPVEGDRITVEYDKADRGLITPATPTSFRSTGWNLYSHARGYARVVKYSETYGFRVAGAYTSLTYSETETGARQTITPVNGAFEVPGDGYVWVAGGNASTTAIYMTWSDWTDGYEGSFAVYTESAISLAAVMAEHFPDGLLAVGGVADVIDLDLQTVTRAIERLDYSEETIAMLEAAGRAYEADADYIYAVLEEPVTVTDIGVSNQFAVNDHGMEYVTGTTVAPVLLLLYGQNLRDKLRMDVVTISQQSLTSAQQRQVRTNLGITPANIGAFGQASVSSSLTDANNIALYGSVMLNGGSCANLPSSTAGAYYLVEFFGPYQIASRHTANVGVGEVWARYYANSQWYPWVRIDGVDAVRTADVANDMTTTAAGKVLDARQGAAMKALIDGLISNTSLGSYSDYAAAADAVFAAMGNSSIRFGKVTIAISGQGSYITTYLAAKSSNNYAAVLFISYHVDLHLAYRSGSTTTNVRKISSTVM